MVLLSVRKIAGFATNRRAGPKGNFYTLKNLDGISFCSGVLISFEIGFRGMASNCDTAVLAKTFTHVRFTILGIQTR